MAEGNSLDYYAGGAFNFFNSENLTFVNTTLRNNSVKDDGGRGGGAELY